MPIKSIVSAGVGRQNLMSLALAGAIKPITEGLIARTPLGNSNPISGVAKIVMGVAAHEFGATKVPIAGNALVAALIVDGGEDVARGLLGGGIGGGNGDGW